MKAEAFLQHAAGVVAQRRSIHGDPSNLLHRLATRWSQVLGVQVTPTQAAVLLIDLKVARLVGDPRHPDTVTDVAGYAGCLAEVLDDA